jgi:hypothetical protein
MSAVQVETPVDNRLVMAGEPWSAYTRWLKLFDERRHVRITYDAGRPRIAFWFARSNR